MHRTKTLRYSITSSALATNDCGMLRPSAFALLRLTTNSNLAGACTGISPGFSPLRMRSTYSGARKLREAALDLTGIAHVQWCELNTKRLCHRTNRRELSDTRGRQTITKD